MAIQTYVRYNSYGAHGVHDMELDPDDPDRLYVSYSGGQFRCWNLASILSHDSVPTLALKDEVIFADKIFSSIGFNGFLLMPQRCLVTIYHGVNEGVDDKVYAWSTVNLSACAHQITQITDVYKGSLAQMTKDQEGLIAVLTSPHQLDPYNKRCRVLLYNDAYGVYREIGVDPDCTNLTFIPGRKTLLLRLARDRYTTLNYDTKPPTVLDLENKYGFIEHIPWSPEGTRCILPGVDSNTFFIPHVRDSLLEDNWYFQMIKFEHEYIQRVTAAAWHPNGNLIAVGDTKKIMLWDVPTATCVGEMKTEEYGQASKILFSPCGRRLIAGFTSGALVIFTN